MTISEKITRLEKLGLVYDNEHSFSGHRVFWYSHDGHSASQIAFATFNEALRYANREEA